MGNSQNEGVTISSPTSTDGVSSDTLCAAMKTGFNTSNTEIDFLKGKPDSSGEKFGSIEETLDLIMAKLRSIEETLDRIIAKLDNQLSFQVSVKVDRKYRAEVSYPEL